MTAIGKPRDLTLGGSAGTLAFVLGASATVLLFTLALTRAEAPPALVLGAMAAGVLVAVVAAGVLRHETAERLMLLYIFLMPLQFFVGGGALISIERASFGFRLAAADLVFPLIFLVLVKTRLDSDSPLRTRSVILFVALIAAIAFSWAQSAFYLQTLSSFSTGKFLGLAYLVVFAAVLVEIIREKIWWDRAIDSLALSGAACGLIGLAGYVLWRLGVGTPMMDYDRVSSTMWTDPNIFGSFMAVSLILSVVRVTQSEGGGRWMWAGCIIVTALALFFSQSRSATMSAILGLAVLGLFARPAVLVAGGLLAVAVVALIWSVSVLIGLPIGTGGIWDEGRFSQDTISSRTEYFRRGASLLPSEGLTGIGIGAFEQINSDVDPSQQAAFHVRAHNTYLASVLELGITGVLALILFAGAVMRAIRDGFRFLEPEDKWRLAGLTASLLAMMLFALFVDSLYQRHLWVLIALLLAVPNIIATTRAQAATDEVDG